MAQDKVLILGPSWVGDMVLAHSLFQELKTQNPSVQIDVAAPFWTIPLIDRMPEISNGIPLPFKHKQLAIFDRIRFGLSLRQEGYTQAILLVNSFKSAILPVAAGIPKRTGFLGEMRYGLLNDIRPLDQSKYPRTIDRFVLLASPGSESSVKLNVRDPVLIASQANALEIKKRLSIDMDANPILALCPGAEYGNAKRWPAEYFSEVANHFLDRDWKVWLFGSDKDTIVTEHINQLTRNRCTDLGGKTKLGEAIDLMSLCDCVVSNDSGLMHVAAALNKKVVAIYGSSDPFHTPPMNPKAVIEYLGLECSPCFERECPLGHLNCLKLIPPSKIIRDLSESI